MTVVKNEPHFEVQNLAFESSYIYSAVYETRTLRRNFEV